MHSDVCSPTCTRQGHGGHRYLRYGGVKFNQHSGGKSLKLFAEVDQSDFHAAVERASRSTRIRLRRSCRACPYGRQP
jgi:hypothetical protein